MKQAGVAPGWWAALAAVLIALAAWGSDAHLLRVDDAFYYFGIARHYADSGLFTFDGLHETNGFQPLWQLLLCSFTVACRAVGVDDPDRLMRCTFLLCAVVELAALGALTALLARVLPGRPRAVQLGWAVAAWPLGLAYVLLSGMESALDLLLLCLLLTTLVGPDGLPTLRSRTAAEIGRLTVLATLAVMARLDNALLLVFLVSATWAVERSRAAVLRGTAWGVATVAGVAPLLLWERFVFGMWLPVSGSVKAWELSVLVQREGLGSVAVEQLQAVAASLAGLPVALVAMGLHEVAEPVIERLGLVRAIALAALTLAGAGACLVRARRGARPVGRPPGGVSLLLAVGLAHLVAMACLFPTHWRYAGLLWYYVPAYVGLVTAAAWLGDELVHGWSPTGWRRASRLVPAAVLVVGLGLAAWRPSAPTDQQLARGTAEWMNDHLPEGAVVAAHNAGVSGYFSAAPVINMDGLVNSRSYLEDYLRPFRQRQYLVDEGITHLADRDCPVVASTGRPVTWRGLVELPTGGRVIRRATGAVEGSSSCVVELGRRGSGAGAVVSGGQRPATAAVDSPSDESREDPP